MSNLGLPKTIPELRWGDDMDPNAAETDSDLESLEQDVMHLLKETLGSNLADQDSGCGVEEFLSGTSTDLANLPALVDAQLANVDRLTGSQTTLTQQSDGTWLLLVLCAVGGETVPVQFALGPGGLSKA